MIFNEHCYVYVEDDPLSREILQTMMQRLMQVTSLVMFEDSKDFLSRLAAMIPRPDIILLDIHVKPYSGFEMLRMLRSDPYFRIAKVVALTASVMNEEVEELKMAGFDATIAKPLNARSFPDLIAKIIEGEPVWSVS